MRKNLRKLTAVAFAILLTGFANQTKANHFQSSELSYICVAPGIYLATLKLSRDCTGTGAPSAAVLNLRSQGCNNGRSVNMTKIGGNRIGLLYCPQIGPPQCTNTSRPNFEEVVFTTTIAFSATEAQCPGWILSWTECCRTSTANLLNAASQPIYNEAFINLGTPGTPISNINNNSAKFQTDFLSSLLFINGSQPVVYGYLAVDPDGDSLVYSLQEPLHNATTSMQYSSFQAPSGNLVNPQDPTQVATVPAPDRGYAATFPMPAYFVDWAQPAPRIPVKSFLLNPHNGSLMFMAPDFIPNTAPSQGQNKYVVVVQVEEYRNLGGNPVKVGSARCDMLVIVDDGSMNKNPEMISAVANGQPLPINPVINLRPGTPLTLNVAFQDANAGDIVNLNSDAAQILSGASWTQTAGNNANGTITWTPSASDVRDQPYYFRVWAKDNGCNLLGIQVQTFGVRVSNTGGVTGISKSLNAQPTFTAYPNPFASEITFKVKQTAPQQEILIYNVLGHQIDQLPLKGQVHTEQEVRWTNAAKFPAGQYIVRFSSGSGQSLKITKLQ